MKKFLLYLGITLTLITGLMIFVTSSLVMLSLKEPVDFYSDDFDINEDHKGDRIEADIPFCYGQAAVLTTTTKKNQYVTKKNTYYYTGDCFYRKHWYVCLSEYADEGG